MKNTAAIIVLTLLPFLTSLMLPEPEPVSPDFTEINPDHIQGPFTGGFNEETCRSCHFDYDLNMDGGSLAIEGISESYKAGKEYNITITVESEQLEVGGFQMTARFEDGTQAGSFDWEGDRLRYTPDIDSDVKYIQHSEEGTQPTDEREVSWSFTWISPAEAKEPVIFNIAANAGNDDDLRGLDLCRGIIFEPRTQITTAGFSYFLLSLT